jgi:phage terminase small subunit
VSEKAIKKEAKTRKSPRPRKAPAEDGLNDQMRALVDAYIGPARFHITKAAIMAGYKERSAYEMGSRNLKRPEVRQYLNERLSEMSLSANQVLARLAEIANGSIEDLLDEDGNFDFKAAKKTGKLALVKKLKRKKSTKTEPVGEGEQTAIVESDDIEFEMYSSHEALRDIGKYHKLFVERHQVEGTVSTYIMTKEEWEKQAAEKIKELNSRLSEK